MNYTFSYYTDDDFDEIEQLVLASYGWEHPAWGLSRHEFVKGLHPDFTGQYHAQHHTVGVYRENGAIVACVINEGNFDGEVFFLFDTQKRATDRELLREMIRYAKTNVSGIKEDGITRQLDIFVPEWNTVLKEMLLESGFENIGWSERLNILPFDNQRFDVKLPDGYTFADGNTVPDFYLSNTHRHSFSYDSSQYACEHGEKAFHELRKMKHYRKELDLCVLDPMKRPVAFAIVWYDEQMPYCELEPLAVAWWERRRGIATALLHELSNRVKAMFPACTGMLGGDQPFYESIGYVNVAEARRYHWELEVFISWDARSADKDYAKEV